ncbi:MAG: hypothetical protein Q8P22_07665, partial [Chloroflexota bacterium]|nr:hypothetical protein [Chloroflexota bacterium]
TVGAGQTTYHVLVQWLPPIHSFHLHHLRQELHGNSHEGACMDGSGRLAVAKHRVSGAGIRARYGNASCPLMRLTGHAATALRAGELELITELQSVTFMILMERSLEEALVKAGVG